ncbi:MAG: DNA-processing protein DprA [Pseudomonadota bacterium]
MAKDSNIPSTHPLTPPLTEEAWLDWFRLLRSRRVGVTTFFRLLDEHGTAAAALDALPKIAADAGVANYTPATQKVAEDEWRAGQRARAVPVAFGSPDYPALLAEIADPPPFFWAIGDTTVLQRPMTALIGARNASSLGTRMAKRLAGELGEMGHVVVSGLARGVDTAAHLAALDTGTIAVMPGGVDVVYPHENAVLAQEIGEKGLLISERPMHAEVRPRHFVMRDRIISGLCRATVVVEAAAKSGTHTTARIALDQGREVLAVPGHPFDARSAGSNMLIRDGAVLLRHAGDLVEALGPAGATAQTASAQAPEPAAPPRTLRETATLHDEILARLQAAPEAQDDLIRALGGSADAIGAELVNLELDGRIGRDPTGRLHLVA